MNEKLIKAFCDNDITSIREVLEQGADKQVLFNYVKDINGWNLTMTQGWILEELHGTKDHGFNLCSK